jgi:hypothetical protein
MSYAKKLTLHLLQPILQLKARTNNDVITLGFVSDVEDRPAYLPHYLSLIAHFLQLTQAASTGNVYESRALYYSSLI